MEKDETYSENKIKDENNESKNVNKTIYLYYNILFRKKHIYYL